MNRPFTIPPITAEDRLPHEKAVWRESPFPAVDRASSRQVSIDYGGTIEATTAERVDWARVIRWRYGWAPQGNPNV